MHRLLWALVAALILTVAHSPAFAATHSNRRRHQVDGTSVVLRQNRAQAQKRAITAGLRKAVYQTILKNMGEAATIQYQSRINGAILNEADQYVQSYQMISRKVDSEARLLKVKLDVVVDLTAVDEAIRALHLVDTKKGESRLLFLVQEQVLRAGAQGRKSAIRIESSELGPGERRLMYDFARAGYTPESPRGQREPARPGQIHAAVSGDVDAARALGNLYGCPFVITASATVERERGGAIVGLASARVIRVDDGAVIAIRSKQIRIPRARGARGYRTALSTASARLAESLLPEVKRVFPPPTQAAAPAKSAKPQVRR